MDIKLIIAVDGYSSCGKSTFAKDIAKIMHYKYIDSGAMYRAFTLYCMQNSAIEINECNPDKIRPLLNNFSIDFIFKESNLTNETLLNGVNVEEEIRKVEVAEKVSYVSRIPEVRHKMVEIQRQLGKNKGIVMDGRDIGTVVFPEADLKIFMTASVKIRAERRYKELIEKGQNVAYEEIEENIKKRDYIDETREVSPLKKADDAIVLDNSNMKISDQMDWFENILAQKFNLNNGRISK